MYSSQLIDHIKKRNQLALDTLDIQTSKKFYNLYEEALKKGILLLYYSGTRDLNFQNELYQKYLRGEGGKAAPPGYSWHNYKRAVDAVPITETGATDWETENYPIIASLGQRYGLKWGGKGDSPHFYDSRGQTLEQLRKLSLENKKGLKNPAIISLISLVLLVIIYKTLRK